MNEHLEIVKTVEGFLWEECEVPFLIDLGSKISKYIEIGSFKGKSAVCVGLGMLSSGRNDCEIHCIDTFMASNEELEEEDTYSEFVDNITRTGVSDLVTVHVGFSQDVVSDFEQDYFDVLLIDGDHSFEGAKRDFDLYRSLVRKGGLIIFHDTNFEDVRKVCKTHANLFYKLESVVGSMGCYRV